MADITNPDVTAFVNGTIRVLADHLVGIKDALDTATIQYVNTVLPAVSGNAGGDMIADGSEADGRTQLSKADLTTLAGMLGGLNTTLSDTATLAALVKAHSNARNPVAG